MLIRISESDDFIVDYDKEKGMYRVSTFENNHFQDEYWFDAYEEKECPVCEDIRSWFSAFATGAAEFMKFLQNYYNGAEPIYPSEMEELLKEFLEQYGEVKETDEQVRFYDLENNKIAKILEFLEWLKELNEISASIPKEINFPVLDIRSDEEKAMELLDIIIGYIKEGVNYV